MKTMLDLFCGLGGAAAGYRKVGFHVTGVDRKFFVNYGGDEFIHGDVMKLDLEFLRSFDCIHASPPCQHYTNANKIHGTRDDHPDLVDEIRKILQATEKPWIMENVEGSPLRRDVILCGSMFNLRLGEKWLQRHRIFELSWPPPKVPKCRHGKSGKTISVFGHGGHVYHTLQEWKKVMEIDWAIDRGQVSEAIPPAYTSFLGRHLMTHLSRKSVPGVGQPEGPCS